MKLFGYLITKGSAIIKERQDFQSRLDQMAAIAEEIEKNYNHQKTELSNKILELENKLKAKDIELQIGVDLQDRLDKKEKLKDTQNKIANDIIENIKSLVVEVNSIATSIDSTVTAVEEVSASVLEISTTAMHIKESAEKSSGETNRLKQTSHKNVEMADQLDTLSKIFIDSISGIKGLVDTIKNITGQIELLSFNASIEAARAGEHGTGFKVVASEMRKLAEKTTIQSTEINSIITKVKDEASKMATHVSTLKDTIKVNDEISSGVISKMNFIVESVSEQAAGTSQIKDALPIVINSIGDIKEKYTLVLNSTNFMTRYLGTLIKFINK